MGRYTGSVLPQQFWLQGAMVGHSSLLPLLTLAPEMAMLCFLELDCLSRIWSLSSFIQLVYMVLAVSLLKGLGVKMVFLGIVKVKDSWNGVPQQLRILHQETLSQDP